MGEWVAATIPSSASLATVISQSNSNFSAGKTVVNGSIEGGGATTPNIASATVDRTRMANNAKVGVYAAESGASSFVVSEGGTKGLQYVSASGLVATYSSGTAWVRQTSTSPDDLVRVVKASNFTVTLTASSDNYVSLKSDGTTAVSVTTIGGPVPALPADSMFLSKATTDATTVTGTPVDLAPTSSSVTPRHYRSRGAWPAPTSTTNFRLPPGLVEVDGITSDQTANQDLDITVSGNYALGARTSNVWLFYLVGNNGGSPKFALTTSTPSAVTVVAGATSGTVGIKQYRKIGSVAYRYIGSTRLVAGGNMLQGSRVRNIFHYASTHSVLTNGNASQFTALSLSARVPPTSRQVILRSLLRVGNTAYSLRETSATGNGISFGTQTFNDNTVAFIPCNASQSVDWGKMVGASPQLDIDVVGYTEELDG